jgi:formylglycine-generating enzyme required for sulfatase activity
VTFDQYDAFVEATNKETSSPDDEGWGRKSRPVINVTWEKAQAYAKWLSAVTGKRYRLPTEAEWEYAARAGTQTAYWWGDEFQPGMAVCDGCQSEWEGKAEGSRTARTDDPNFGPNAFGLYHTAGNVWEWVEDCWHNNYKGASRPDDGKAWLESDGGDCARRVLRGGSWDNEPRTLRSANRDRNYPGNWLNGRGFRLAQDP